MKTFTFANGFNLNDIVLILSLSDSSSMSATSRELGIDVSTVSRRVAAAEKALGTRLFTRTDSGFKLTEIGQVFVERAEQIHGQIATMMLNCTEQAAEINGVVRITSIEFLFDYWLVHHLPELKICHPGLQLELLSSDSNLSFTRREADFALRLSRPNEDAALRMRKFGELGFAVYGTPEFACVPRADWPNQPWITYDDSLSHTPEMQWLNQIGPMTRKHLRVSTLGTMVRACVAGNGLALLPCLLGSQTGLQMLSTSRETTRDIWLLSHRDAGSIARFNVVAAWLNEIYSVSRKQFLGPERD